jgi:hypothetical protein
VITDEAAPVMERVEKIAAASVVMAGLDPAIQ